jgi:hypothetical protein
MDIAYKKTPKEQRLTYRSDEEMLQKYGLKANDAILAEEKHMGIFDDRQCTRDLWTSGL